MRWSPVVAALAFSLLVPGALAHHCVPEGSDPSEDFSVQSTAAPSAPGPLVVALLLVPVAVAGIVAAAAHGSGKAPSAVSGRWVWTPERWVFLREP